jgi:drug/metabolite transporter (DMT)-like permease
MKTKSDSETTWGVVFGLLSAVCVAGYVITNKYIYTHYDISSIEYSIVFAFAGGFYALLALLYKIDKERIDLFRQNLPDFTGLALATTLGVSGFTMGLRYTTAINASLLATLTIVTTAFFSHLLVGEKHSKQQYIWITTLFLGLYLAIVGLHSIHFRKGDLIILSSMAFFGFGNAYSRLVMKRLGSAKLVPDARLVIGSVFALIASVFFLRHFALIWSLLPFALLAGLFYWLCIRTFAQAVHRINANNAVVLNNVHIFITSFVGVLLLSERYSWEKFVGSVVAIVSIYFIAYKKRSAHRLTEVA